MMPIILILTSMWNDRQGYFQSFILSLLETSALLENQTLFISLIPELTSVSLISSVEWCYNLRYVISIESCYNVPRSLCCLMLAVEPSSSAVDGFVRSQRVQAVSQIRSSQKDNAWMIQQTMQDIVIYDSKVCDRSTFSIISSWMGVVIWHPELVRSWQWSMSIYHRYPRVSDKFEPVYVNRLFHSSNNLRIGKETGLMNPEKKTTYLSVRNGFAALVLIDNRWFFVDGFGEGCLCHFLCLACLLNGFA